MASWFPNVRTLAGMVQTGLFKLTNWLFGRIASEEGRIQFLSGRYPNASGRVIRSGLDAVEAATESGALFNLGPSQPTDAELQIDPTHAAQGRYAYHVDITGYGYLAGTGRGRPGKIIDRFHLFYSDNALSKKQLNDMVRQYLLDQITSANDYGFAKTPDARLTRFDAVVLAITRSN